MNLVRRGFCAATAAALAGAVSPALAKEKVTLAYLLDPVYESFLYALKTGKVKSDAIEIDATPMSVPATMQAMATKQFDVVSTSTFSIPEGQARGLDVRILSVAIRYRKDGLGGDLWVKGDSPYKSIADLKGKTIASTSYTAASTTLVRIAISMKHGLNVKFENGDFQWVQIPTGAQATALATGRVEASTLLHTLVNQAQKSGTFRSILRPTVDIHEKYGVELATVVFVGYPDRLAARPAAFKEFNRMMKESRDYAMANLDEVAAAAAGSKMPKTFLKDWLDTIASFPAAVSDDDVKSIRISWQASKDLGLIQNFTDPEKIVWDGAVRVK
jgi:NitT/TauT family transport system substrate-binding protein